MKPVQDLRAPSLLLAMPQVQDPFFCRSIVLLAAHEDDGSFGFVINRPTDLKIEEVLEDLDITWKGEPEQPAFMGGPVRPHIGTVLFPSPKQPAKDGCPELAPGISMTQNRDSLSSLAENPPNGLRLLLGYAGWSRGQLVDEVSRHDWLLAPAEADLVFSSRPEDAWERALAWVGIESSALVNWLADDQQAN